MKIDPTTSPYIAPDPRTATPRTLRRADIEDLLLLSLSGGEPPSIAGALEANAKELELLYELFDSRGDQWVAAVMNQVQQRLRVLAELSRRQEERQREAAAKNAS